MSSPVPMFGTQDLNDDDGPVIDSFLIETDAPPNLKDAPVTSEQPKLESPKVITRLFSSDWTMDPAWGPVLVFPADANRKSLYILVYSPTSVATDGVRFSDDPGTARQSAKILHQQDINLEGHTGAVYAIACGAGAGGVASAPVSLEIWSVTE